MTDPVPSWRTVQVAPPPNDWVAIFETDDGSLEVRNVVGVLVQEYVWAKDVVRVDPARAVLGVATFDGYLVPAIDLDGFSGVLPRAEYEKAKAKR